MPDDQNNFTAPLSEPGQIRRGEILRIALATAKRRRDRRRMTIAAVVAFAMLLPTAILVQHQRAVSSNQIAVLHPDKSKGSGVFDVPKPQQRLPTPLIPAITFVQTDAQIAQRLAVAPPRPTWQTLDDDQLLTRLSEIGQPGALAIVSGKPRLILLNSQPRSDGM